MNEKGLRIFNLETTNYPYIVDVPKTWLTQNYNEFFTKWNTWYTTKGVDGIRPLLQNGSLIFSQPQFTDEAIENNFFVAPSTNNKNVNFELLDLLNTTYETVKPKFESAYASFLNQIPEIHDKYCEYIIPIINEVKEVFKKLEDWIANEENKTKWPFTWGQADSKFTSLVKNNNLQNPEIGKTPTAKISSVLNEIKQFINYQLKTVDHNY
ncbi:hypothetical protein [Mycoplasmopsis felifaucium]|uniref:Uncharacterized protein n=1 Tax=Mycoplasmopsis felifaucium TaxID=35768 RepID=A0ABZ2RWU1_9BACT